MSSEAVGGLGPARGELGFRSGRNARILSSSSVNRASDQGLMSLHAFL